LRSAISWSCVSSGLFYLSVIATLFCCLPGGIVGIVFAAQAATALSGGDYATAAAKAKTAKMAALISMGAGVLMYVFVVVMGVLGQFVQP